MAAFLTDRDWVNLMQAHPELGAFPASLRRQTIDVAAAAGEPIFRLGAQPHRMLWVVDGEVRLIRRSRNGGEIVLQRAYAGFVAEASLESSRYHCDAVAAADTRLLGFPIEPFREALRDDGKFRAFWMTRLAREVRSLRAQCERLSLRSAADRIEHYIEAEGDNGRIELRRTRKAWAAELGLTHEALYRTLASLQQTGRITAVESKDVLVLTLSATGTRK
jgi:CRP/FNR family transcriptional regulator, dissimilatory nitrate respiration regulator